jgi:hypothetical protein
MLPGSQCCILCTASTTVVGSQGFSLHQILRAHKPDYQTRDHHPCRWHDCFSLHAALFSSCTCGSGMEQHSTVIHQTHKPALHCHNAQAELTHTNRYIIFYVTCALAAYIPFGGCALFAQQHNCRFALRRFMPSLIMQYIPAVCVLGGIVSIMRRARISMPSTDHSPQYQSHHF